MDVQVNPGQLVHAIPTQEIARLAAQVMGELRQQIEALLEQFSADPLSPSQLLDLENRLADRLRESGRRVIEGLVCRLEPELEQMPKAITHQGKSHRRLAEKSQRADVVTRFGRITFLRARYRRGRSGRTIFPLEMLLGIENGFTPAAATRVGKQFAATGSSQGRTREMVEDQMGTKIGTEKLRKRTATLAAGMEPFRERAQVDEILKRIEQARERKLKPVLSISRDGVALGLAWRSGWRGARAGVALGLAPWSFLEMASVACVSVLAGGKKLGTVYLGCTPETIQGTLSNQLTSLLERIVRRCGDSLPEIVYVSDAGKIETAYWKNTLRKFFVDGVRIKITRVVDYSHAAERLTTIARALKLGKNQGKRQSWLEHARWLLLQPGGHGRMLRSIAKMREFHGYKASEQDEAEKAERYLRRYRRFMNYAEMKSRGYPIGSGVVVKWTPFIGPRA